MVSLLKGHFKTSSTIAATITRAANAAIHRTAEGNRRINEVTAILSPTSDVADALSTLTVYSDFTAVKPIFFYGEKA
jgi:hypothetical protein